MLQADRDGARRRSGSTERAGVRRYWVGLRGSAKGRLGTDDVAVRLVTKCEFVYGKEVTGGRRLGTHGKSETNKE